MALLTTARDEQELAERIADRLVALVGESARAHGAAHVVLTGGRTPKTLYELLAAPAWQARVPWDLVHLYWSDERHVPPDHPESNFGMARDALILHVPIPASQVHRMRGELSPDETARVYEGELPERLDVMLLGVGEDGHIASVFRHSPLLGETSRRVAGVWAPHLNAYRITLTPAVLLAPAHILVLVAGAAKAAAVAASFDHRVAVDRCPARLLAPAGNRVEWFIDREAAKALSSRPT